jgi:hypothetical protein
MATVRNFEARIIRRNNVIGISASANYSQNRVFT